MAKTKITWREKPFKIAITSTLDKRIASAMILLRSELKRVLSTPYPPASRPGHPPHKRTGKLRKSVQYRKDRKKNTYEIGAFKDAEYGWYLEKGVRNEDGSWKIAPRPWLVKTMLRMKRQMALIIEKGR